MLAVLLPGTTFGLGQQHYADARTMSSLGLPVALGSDLNPGTCWCESMPFIIALAYRFGANPVASVIKNGQVAYPIPLAARRGASQPHSN